MSRVAKTALLTAVAGAAVLGASGLASATSAGSGAHGVAQNSPGVGSGNVVQAPVHVPVNACGNTVSVVGLLNPDFGNPCLNH